MNSSRGLKSNAFAVLMLAMVLIFLGVLFGPALLDTWRICWFDDDYSHGLVLPLVSAYLLWENRKTLLQALRSENNSRKQSWQVTAAALAALIVGLGLYVLGRIGSLLFPQWLAFFFVLGAVLYLVLPHSVAHILSPPLLLNFMAKPIPDSLVPRLFFPLQVLAARTSAFSLEILGVPVHLRGNVIEIPHMTLMVEEACSGLRSMMALLTVAIIVLMMVRIPRSAKVVIVGISVLLAVLLNVFRVTFTGILAHFFSAEAARGFFHEFSGMVVFVVGLVILYQVGLVVRRLTCVSALTDKNAEVER